MANIAELERVLGYIKAHPEQHDQGSWFNNECGTTACFAGHTLLLNGYEVAYCGRFAWVYKDGDRLDAAIPTLARRILDLNSDQVDALFYCASNLPQVEAVVKAIANDEL